MFYSCNPAVGGCDMSSRGICSKVQGIRQQMGELSNHLAAFTQPPSLSVALHLILKEIYAAVAVNLRQSLYATLMFFFVRLSVTFHCMYDKLIEDVFKCFIQRDRLPCSLKVTCVQSPTDSFC